MKKIDDTTLFILIKCREKAIYLMRAILIGAAFLSMAFFLLLKETDPAWLCAALLFIRCSAKPRKSFLSVSNRK